MKPILFLSVLFSLPAFASYQDDYMKNYTCLEGQSWAACLSTANDKVEVVLNKNYKGLRKCLSKKLGSEAVQALDAEQNSFISYYNGLETAATSLDVGAHRAQDIFAEQLEVRLQRNELLKSRLDYCRSFE